MEKLTLYRSVAALLAVDVIHQENNAASPIPPVTAGEPINLKVNRPTRLPAARAVKNKRNLLGEMLVSQHVISEQQLKEALAVQSSSREKKKQFLGNILVQMRYCTEEAIVRCLSGQLRIEEIREFEVSQDVKKLIPFSVAKRYFICPIRKRGSTLEVAMLDPTNMSALDDLSFLTSLRIQAFIATNKALQDGWAKLYGYIDEKGVQRFLKPTDMKRELMYHNFAKEEDEEAQGEDELGLAEYEQESFEMGDLESLVSGVVEDLQIVTDTEAAPMALDVDDAPVVKLVNTILRQAIKMGASDSR